MALDARDDMAAFEFSYRPAESEGEGEVQLPFRLLVLGEFLPEQSLEDYESARPIAVTLRQFDRLLAAQEITLDFQLYELELSPACEDWFEGSERRIRIPIHALEDFNPEMMAQREPTLARVQRLLMTARDTFGLRPGARAETRMVDTRVLSFEDRRLLGLADGEDLVAADTLEFLLSDLGASLNEALNRILHHPKTRKLEAAWRGLHYLVRVVGDHPECHVCFLPAALEHLREDLERSPELTDSHLYELLYVQEYGQFGGKPYAALVADYAFGLGQEDLDTLRRLACLGQAAHAPVIAQAAPSFFGIGSFGELAALSSLRDLQAGARYVKWRSLQASPEAQYLVLTLPRILLRAPYSMANGNVNSVLYEEDLSNPGESPYLWGNAVYAMAGCLARSFQRYGICTDITGERGGEVAGLPRVPLRDGTDLLLPVEVLLSENKEAELIGLGFTPLSVAKAQDRMLFPAANSVYWGYLQASRPQDVIDHLGAQLPYLFVILRIAHYLKVISRDLIGSLATPGELESHLQSWLKRYVADVENPSQSVRARRPLKRVSLELRPDPERPEWMRVALRVTPHMKYMDREFALNLDVLLNGRL